MLARFGILPALAIKAASLGTGRPSQSIGCSGRSL
jgi:hypothetical protein